MSQSISDIMRIFENELELLGARIGSPEMIRNGQSILPSKNIVQLNIQMKNKNEDFPEFLIRNLAKEIIKRTGTSFSFKELILPTKEVEIACLCRKGQILFRYYEDYFVHNDEIGKQIDVLI